MNREKQYVLVAYALLAVAFGYTLLRAIIVPVFHDEAVTYYYLSLLPYSQILDYSRQSFAPNNHFLNTFLIKIFTQLFGVSELTLRLPALIGHLIYLIAVYRICRLVAQKEIVVGGIVLLAFNPFMLELFSAARGYALGVGFFALALYYLLRRVTVKDEEEIKSCLMAASIFLAFAVMANFTFLQVYISFFLLVLLYELKSTYPSLKKGMSRLLAFSYSVSLIIFFCLSPMIVIRQRLMSEPYLGGEQGFWRDTVTSLIQDSLYGQYLKSADITSVVNGLLVILLLTALFLISQDRRKINSSYRFLLMTTSWLAVTVAFMFFQWKIFGIKYVIGRHAVFFIPLFMTMAMILWVSSQSIRKKAIYRAIQAGFWVIALMILAHFGKSANLKYFYVCPYAASVREMVDDIARHHAAHPSSGVEIGTHWLFTPMINFYRIKNQFDWLAPLKYHTQVDRDADYYYVFSEQSAWTKAGDQALAFDLQEIKKLDLEIIRQYNATETYLAVKKP